ncbi:major facilitator superfamily domain-containing protein [Xylogone sp. PMI_703]|nr:major facilitator superfamily domain-containing protein [Xylogone sp. PMI_703]
MDDSKIEESKPPAEAEVIALEAAVEYFIDPEEDRRVLWKIDRVVMPIMMIVLFFQYLDKQSINYATVFNMNKDLNLSGLDFSWVVTLFYFGQMAGTFLSAYFISRYNVVRVVGITVFFWGVCEMCFAATQNFAGIGTARFFLGFCEGAVSPGFVVITSNWYKRREHPIRVAWWTTSGGLATICGAILMYLVGGAHHLAIANWRAMFLICGGVTLLNGLLFIFVMPLDTTVAWFLTEDERRVATERLALDRATRDRSEFNFDQVKEALTDPHSWMYFLFALFICIPSPILKFSSLVISGFGFNKFMTMLVGLPSGAIQIIAVWISALGIRWTKDLRSWWGFLMTLVPLVGSITMLCLPKSDKWGIVVSTWLAACTSSLMIISTSMIASNVKGNTKKSIVSNMFFIGYTTGCIIGPQLWQAQDAPRYTKGCISSIVSWGLLLITYATHYFYLKRENKKRAEMVAQIESGAGVADDTGKPRDHIGVEVNSDITDRQDLRFVYHL